MATIGEKIREARNQRGMTQAELSQDLVTPSMISQIESGKTKPSYPLLTAIANRLGLPVEHFLSNFTNQYSSMSGIQMARCYVLLGQTALALTILQDAEQPDPPGLAYEEYQLTLAEALRRERMFDKATVVVEGLREYALRNQDMGLLFAVCHQSGYIEYDTRNYDGAIHEWETAIQIGETIESSGHLTTVAYQSIVSEIALNLHNIYRQQNDHTRAQELLQTAFALSKSSSTLRSVASSLIQDGQDWLSANESVRAQDAFRSAATIAEASRFMERSISVKTAYQQFHGDIPSNPWQQAAMSATTVSPATFLKCELETLNRLLNQGNSIDLETEVAPRVSTCQAFLNHYIQDDPDLKSMLEPYRIQLEYVQARIEFCRGQKTSAIQRLSVEVNQMEAEGLPPDSTIMDLWITMASNLVKWQIDTGIFEPAIELTMRIHEVHKQRQRQRIEDIQVLPLTSRESFGLTMN